MALENRLELKLAQKLVLTPQLQMAIKLLQMPQLELSQTLTNELLENPFLEETAESTPAEEVSREEAESTEQFEESDDTEKPIENLLTFSSDDYYDERSYDGRDLGYFTPGVVTPPSFENFLSSTPDLYEHLIWQLRLSREKEEIRRLGEIIIGNLDDNGYLHLSIPELAGTVGSSEEAARYALMLIQSFDPPGIAARDLTECLLLQVSALDLKGTLVEDIIVNDLDSLGKKKYQQIAKRFNTSIENVMSAVRIIEGLEPKPGRNFSSAAVNYVVPDVFVMKADDGYQIVLNDEGLPRIRISSYYQRLLSQRDLVPKEDRPFLEDKLRSAVWLMKSLSQRNKTIYRVTESIVNFQKEFFDQGISYLKPLNLKDVAGDLDLHESTISRVTSNKYLSCAQGIYGFKFFFSNAISSDTGSMSSTSIKEMIKKIIAEEDHRKPMSDMHIVDVLKMKNISIARRTVAKYREELKIPPHSQRKRISTDTAQDYLKGGNNNEHHN